MGSTPTVATINIGKNNYLAMLLFVSRTLGAIVSCRHPRLIELVTSINVAEPKYCYGDYEYLICLISPNWGLGVLPRGKRDSYV